MESLLTIADNLESSYAAPKKDENGKFDSLFDQIILRFKLEFLYSVK